MLIIVNCLNAFMEKCDSRRLRIVVEAAEMIRPSRVIVWSNPTAESMGRTPEATRSEYDLAVYPEIAKWNLPTSIISGLDRLPKEFYEEVRLAREVLLCGCNSEEWLVKIALEMWNVYRIRPGIIIDGWFTIGAPGAHGKALNELTRHFGSGSFKDWDVIKAPIMKLRAELAASLLSSSRNP